MSRQRTQPRKWRVWHGGKVICDTDRAAVAYAVISGADRFDYVICLRQRNSSVRVWPPAEELALPV